MCGRYVIKNPVTKTNKLVKSAIQVEDTENYNAHPYQKLPVIKKYKNGNTLENLQWGLVPGWAKDKDFKALINARLETIDEKVSFKKSQDDIDQVLSLEKRHFGALAGQGLVNIQLKNYEKAIRSYEQAQEIYPAMRSPKIMIKQIKELIKEQTI